MSVKVAQVLEAIEKIAPRRYAEAGDKIGLQLGNPAVAVEKILITLDITDSVVKRAINDGVGMIISHHPLIFSPLKDLREDNPYGIKLAKLIRAGIAVCVAHTNFDSCPGGINDLIASRLGLENISVLDDKRSDNYLKLAVYVPLEAEEAIKEAMFKAGAGHIGNYSDCSFTVDGKASFKPLREASPTVGSIDNLHSGDERRVEVIVFDCDAKAVIKAMLRVHPYEVPAYDIVRLENPGESIGLGRIGVLPEPLSLSDFAIHVKSELRVSQAGYVGHPDKTVHKVALCGGSGSSLITTAQYKGADVYLSSEFGNHHFVETCDNDMSLVQISHFGAEKIMIEAFAKYLQEWAVKLKWKISPGNILADNLSEDYIKMV